MEVERLKFQNEKKQLDKFVGIDHPSNRKELEVGGPGDEIKLFIDSFIAIVAAKAKKTYRWMLQLVNRNRPLKFVEEAES